MDEGKLERMIRKTVGRGRITVQQARDDIDKAKQYGMRSIANRSESYSDTHKVKTGRFKGVFSVDLDLINRASNNTGRGNYRLGMDKHGNELYIFAHNSDGSYKPIVSFN
ncbi:MAG: hypothetical protein ACMXX9_04165 [Candidatus Woesearchaeota archaeon]